jgi:hypothetical protein
MRLFHRGVSVTRHDIAHKFGFQGFELITISTDDPKDSAKVKAFLEKRGSGLLDRLKPSLKAEGRTTNSSIFSDPDTNVLVKTIYPQWPGAIRTVLVDTRGQDPRTYGSVLPNLTILTIPRHAANGIRSV